MMPGKSKFQDIWLTKEDYKELLARDLKDHHLARCRACCKSVKVDREMGEAALSSLFESSTHFSQLCGNSQ
ncbi:hypothetical protein PHYPO_G00072400 [Pangasianodon hypophthalmus]|uniref:Uncharacterized protein n=1 Tax=Pangasianodon hypophthalmus TaxID=310915 RepID=A0A5N5LUT2_PANHP|nr:hypothetical protein PHYPO_G00072400 [Pangasianodon hypophthalmus]